MNRQFKSFKTYITGHWKCSEENPAEGEEDEPTLTSCGLGSWRPKWMQIFASPVFFMINFSLVGIIQGMTGTYFVGSMSTLEKRFAFDSKVSGFIMIADNFSQMMVSPIIGYLGSRFNRPRMIAVGELILSLSCFTTALPYFIYGPGTHLLHDSDLASKLMRNETKYELCPSNPSDIDCSDGKHSTVWPAVFMLWMGSFLRGLGFTAYFVIGMTYIDDSVSKKKSPIYISLILAFRLIGPAGGYFLSALSLRFYENPFYDPGITRLDPRFIGAWWIGFTVIGVFLFFATLPMFLFPQQFKGASVKAKELKENIKGIKGTVSAIKRLAQNPIVMIHLVGSCFRYIGLGGYFTFKNKYIESQYRQSSSGASFKTGLTSKVPMAIGIILGGVMITFAKPRPRTLVIYMFLVELCSNAGILSAMFLGCPPLEMPMNQFNPSTNCNSGCDCTTSVYTPICGADERTIYFSPCYAGCHSLNRTTKTLTGCNCVTGGSATTGFCQSDSDNCNKLNSYLLVLALGSVISSTARTGNYLLTLRSVDPMDKSFAMGMISLFLAVFAFIPYPLIFGAITDSVCLVWKKTCGKRGNCWIYDQDKFRYSLHGWALAFMTVGCLFDFVLIFKANKIKNFYDEPNDDKQINEKQQKSADNNINSDIHMSALGISGAENDITIVDQTLVSNQNNNYPSVVKND